MLDKMMKEMLFGKDSAGKDESMLNAFTDRKTHEKIVQAMTQNAEAKLFELIAEKITATLKAEGELDLQALREKCSSVARLREDLLLSHLKYTEGKGLIGSRCEDGTTVYFALPGE